ncbi:MAG: type II toxin-antitoxin system HicB family antitoxin [Verrucomicrobiota bacterium]|nr:type II toxin-antitoxin system HicB family antitoxin [Verrucomicrobiota bacterium]
MKKVTYEIVIEREDDPKAGYSVYCPDLPGCFSNGGSIEESKRNMAEAISLHLESLRAIRKRHYCGWFSAHNCRCRFDRRRRSGK